MGNLFRCPMNYDNKEYILKYRGLVQNGYSYKMETTHTGGTGDALYEAHAIHITYYGILAVYYPLDLTNWNKIYVVGAVSYAQGSSTKGIIGVCKPVSNISDIKGSFVYSLGLTNRPTDHVIDVSELSGMHWFCIYGEITSSSTSSLVEASVGDVYLSR